MPQTSSEDLRSTLERIAAPVGSSLPLPRLLIVLAHPDDEVLALGARLERLSESRLLTVTDGAPANGADASHHGFASLEAYREARQKELRRALADAALPERLAENNTLPKILPVADQTVCLHLVELIHAVVSVAKEFKPEAVLTHPFEGGHPDHDGCAFAVHTAMEMVGSEQASSNGGRVPPIVETPFYFSGENGSMRTGCFSEVAVSALTMVRELSPEEQTRKRARLAYFASQAQTLAQFGVERELFRAAPAYDFLQPPHNGQVFYERFPWGMTSEQFRALAAAARATLGREGSMGR